MGYMLIHRSRENQERKELGMSLRKLRQRAKRIDVHVEAERDDYGWGYWLVYPESDNDPLAGDRFCATHSEIAYKLEVIAASRDLSLE